MDEPTLQVQEVRHRYGAATALDGVDLTVAPGECVALLGPNGAGKTTLIGLATGLLAVQHGRVRVAGGDPRQASVRAHLGVVHQTSGYLTTPTVAELVRGAAVRAGRRRAAAIPVLAELGLTDLARRRAATLSGGQRQRVGLAMALVGDPTLLLLDEPTTGLDVAAQRDVRRIVGARRDRGVGVLLTTHVVGEAAAVADRVVVLHRGRVVAADTPDGLTALLPDCTVSARTRLTDDQLRALPGLGLDTVVRRDGDHVRVGCAAPEELLRHWLAADPALDRLRVVGAGLEDALVALTGLTGHDEGAPPGAAERHGDGVDDGARGAVAGLATDARPDPRPARRSAVTR